MTNVVVVTGAANGIGRATARHMIELGWIAVAIDRDTASLERLALDSTTFVPVVGDITQVDVLERARSVAENLGELRGWVNNAAVLQVNPLHLMSREDIDLAISVNLRGVVEGTQTALKSFLSTGVVGTIVNVSSIHARGAFPGNSIYDACKGAIEALTRSVCVEYGHLGIRCNAVAPGAVLTDMGSIRLRDGVSGAPPLAALSPMNRVSEPDEIAHLIAFLLSPAAQSVNGHVLAADNGMSARVFPFPPDARVGFAKPGD